MNIVLNIGGQEVEVDKSFDFAITKTYEELQNPTIINNEWSKTLSIPMTSANNRLFGDIFNVERALIGNASATNTGIYFNPTKKANFTLYYNSGILMTGYAKLSAVDNVKNTYEINLFGEIGNTFLELLKCTFNKNGEDARYILPNYLSDNLKLSKELVKASWDNDEHRISLDDANLSDTDIIGFAPTSCGLPKDFESDTVLDGAGGYKKLADYINELKGIEYGDTIIGDGLSERAMSEFRIQNQKPYIYVDKLWQIFVKKSEEICEFPLKLDKTWFNIANPYYYNLVYLCQDLESAEKDNEVEHKTVQNMRSFVPTGARESYPYVFDADFQTKTAITFTLDSGIRYEDMHTSTYTDKRHYTTYEYDISPYVYLKIGITDTNNNTKYFAVVSNMTWIDGDESFRPTDTGITIVNETKQVMGDLSFNFTIPFDCSLLEDGCYFSYEWVYYNNNFKSPYASKKIKRNGLDNERVIELIAGYSYIQVYGAQSYYEYDVVNFERIWNPDIPPFNVLLNYAKMFGLIFQVNQEDRCIDVTCRNVYFDDYTIEDWTDKINTLNTYKIEQPTFEKRYVNFNYDDVDGNNYTKYKDKYLIQLGGMRLETEYEFNNDEENLFEGIQPSNVVNEKIVTLKQLQDWVVDTAIKRVDNPEIYFDNRKDNESANIYSSFVFRRKNQQVSTIAGKNYVKITEDTQVEKNDGAKCYHGDYNIYDNYAVKSYIIPFLSIIDDSGKFGCTFNLPNDINFNSSVMPYKSAVFIYDNFWKDYIDERYNSENKKITLQVNLSPLDFANFEFRKLVKINNTLYIVNKINNYGIGNGENTEVELISVSDLSKYNAGKKFSYAYWSEETINFKGDDAGIQQVFTVGIDSNINWTLQASSSSVSLNKTSGVYSDEITITLAPLTGIVMQRTSKVNILNNKGEVIDVLTIKQSKRSIDNNTEIM